jgi:hypothetical protein
MSVLKSTGQDLAVKATIEIRTQSVALHEEGTGSLSSDFIQRTLNLHYFYKKLIKTNSY